MRDSVSVLARFTSTRRIMLTLLGLTLVSWVVIVTVMMPVIDPFMDEDNHHVITDHGTPNEHRQETWSAERSDIQIPESPRKRGDFEEPEDPTTQQEIENDDNDAKDANYQSHPLKRVFNDFKVECPEKFPSKVPPLKDLRKVCSNLKDFKLYGGCDVSNCSKCIPPGSESMPWVDRDVKPFFAAYEKTTTSRRAKLKSMLSHLDPDEDGPLLMMVFNYGYAYLFFNWVCSVDFNEIKGMRNRTIVITMDEKTQSLVESTGFIAYHPDWLGNDLLNRVDKKAAASFALGAHRWTVTTQIVMLTDLIHMGYDVVLQDSDIVWNKDPLPYLMQPEMQAVDVQMTVDGRIDNRGPGNSGFLIIRSNCKTQIFMDTMVSLVSLVLVGRSDQILWNILLDEKVFRQVHFETLPTDLFVSGFQVNLKKKTSRNNLGKDHFMVHASWTTDQFDKIEKFWNLDHWYFGDEKCPKYYDRNMLPDMPERKWHIRDKTQPQEKKLKELGLVRDSQNGTYVREEPK